MKITWNMILCWILFPIWIPLNDAAYKDGFLWLVGWWVIFYSLVELYRYPVKKDIFGNEI